MQQRPPDSKIPKVVGILMIVFGSLGLLSSVIALASGGMRGEMVARVPDLKPWNTVTLLLSTVGLAISVLHLYVGVRALNYKWNAPRLAVVYAAASVTLTALNTILLLAWGKPLVERAMLEQPGGELATAMFGPLLAISIAVTVAWCALVAFLMTRPAAKAACTVRD
jgi:hypothetical protein